MLLFAVIPASSGSITRDGADREETRGQYPFIQCTRVYSGTSGLRPPLDTFFLNLEDISPFCKVTDTRFGLLVTDKVRVSALGLKAIVDPLACMLRCLRVMKFSDSPLVRHLLTPSRPAWWPSRFDLHILETNLVVHRRESSFKF